MYVASYKQGNNRLTIFQPYCFQLYFNLTIQHQFTYHWKYIHPDKGNIIGPVLRWFNKQLAYFKNTPKILFQINNINKETH